VRRSSGCPWRPAVWQAYRWRRVCEVVGMDTAHQLSRGVARAGRRCSHTFVAHGRRPAMLAHRQASSQLSSAFVPARCNSCGSQSAPRRPHGHPPLCPCRTATCLLFIFFMLHVHPRFAVLRARTRAAARVSRLHTLHCCRASSGARCGYPDSHCDRGCASMRRRSHAHPDQRGISALMGGWVCASLWPRLWVSGVSGTC